MSWGIVATLGSAVIGAGATMAAGKAQSKAINQAASTEAQASAQNIAAAEAERARNEALFAPEVGRGSRADAYLDALYLGNGSYDATPTASGPASAYGASPSQSLEQTLRAQNPDMARFWDTWEANDKGKANGHRAVFGDFAGYVRAERPQAIAAAQAQLSGGVPGQPGGPAYSPTSVSRDDVMAQINANPLMQQAGTDFNARNAISDAAYSGETSLAGDERGQGYGVTNSRYAALNDLSGAERGAAYGNADDLFGARSNLATSEQGDALDLATGMATTRGNEAGRARTDREGVALGNRDALRGVGTENFDRALGYLDEDLATRTGYTDTAIADRSALNDIYQGQARDRVASMLGVTGQVGKAARAGAERANELDLEFASTKRDWRNQDYDPYAQGRSGADAQRGSANLEAERAYGGAKSNAAEAYSSDMKALIDYYGGDVRAAQAAYYARMNTGTTDRFAQRGVADTRYYGQRAGAEADKYASYGAYDQGYYDRLNTSLRDRTQRRTSAYDTKAADWRSAYGGYEDYLTGQSTRGQQGRQNIASGGQATLGITSGERTNAARAAADAAYARGNVAANQWNAYGQIAGDAYGSLSTTALKRRVY